MSRTCKWCDERLPSAYPNKKFCDPLCKSKHFHASKPRTHPPYAKVHTRQCGTCQRGFLTAWRTARFCSSSCGAWWRNNYVKPCRCFDCDTVIPTKPENGRRFCEPCSLARKRNSSRRKRMKRSGVRAARYSISYIAKRDGFRCHLCKRLVDMRKNGNHLDGPTLDHLIPISAGGSDTPENVRLAHRDCNTRRGTGGTVQLLLVG